MPHVCHNSCYEIIESNDYLWSINAITCPEEQSYPQYMICCITYCIYLFHEVSSHLFLTKQGLFKHSFTNQINCNCLLNADTRLNNYCFTAVKNTRYEYDF